MKKNQNYDNSSENGYVRDKNDFFATTPDVIEAFKKAEYKHIPLTVWEPACGDGAICKGMPAIEWVATDLVDRGFGLSGVDFLMERKKLADAIVTNPPFKLLYEFMMKAIDLDIKYIAIFHPIGFLNNDGWREIFERRRPARIYTLVWRPDIFGIGQPDQRCRFAWSIWDGDTKATNYHIMLKTYGDVTQHLTPAKCRARVSNARVKYDR